MTFNETYFKFDAEVARLEDEIEDLKTELEELGEDSPKADDLAAQFSSLQSQRKGVIWARDHALDSDDFPQWDDDVDGVTLAAIRAGAFGRLQDDLEADPDAGGGTSTNLLIAEGSVSNPSEGEQAPYVEESMTNAQEAAAVAQLHPFYRKWAEARINELLDPEAGNATV